MAPIPTGAKAALGIAATLAAIALATEIAATKLGNTWNGAMWAAARSRYELYVKQHPECTNSDIKQFIAHSGKGTLMLVVHSKDLYDISYEGPGVILGEGAPTQIQQQPSDDGDELSTLPTVSAVEEVKEPVADATDSLTGVEIYRGWKAVWKWVSLQKPSEEPTIIAEPFVVEKEEEQPESVSVQAEGDVTPPSQDQDQNKD